MIKANHPSSLSNTVCPTTHWQLLEYRLFRVGYSTLKQVQSKCPSFHHAAKGNFFSRIPIVVGMCFLIFVVSADAQPASPRVQSNTNMHHYVFPSPGRPQVRLSVEQQQTIERALQDLQSNNVEYRAGAVMLLGKYEVPAAQDAVIRALQDPHKRVRRAALVSVTEWSRKAPVAAVEPVLSLLGDPDVEIRRMASSALQVMFTIHNMARMSSFGRSHKQPLSAAIQQVLVDAFEDEDVVVRRNMVSQYSKSFFTVPPDTFLKLLSDPDQQVRITALPLASSHAGSAAFLKAAEHLVDDEDKAIRLLLLRYIAKHNQQQGVELLQRMINDPDVEVAAEAELWLLQNNNDPALFATLYQRYQQQQLTNDQASRMIQLAAGLGDVLKDYIYQLIETDDRVVRYEAIRLFLDMPWQAQHEPYLQTFINDSSMNVRRLCMEYFQSNHDHLSAKLLAELVFSEHADVRRFLLQLSDEFSVDDAQFVIDELILDEDTQVRIAALNKMARTQLEGWDKVLAASLKDPNTEIQKAAVAQLLNTRDPKAIMILNQYLNEHPQTSLTAYIQSVMRRRNSFQGL